MRYIFLSLVLFATSGIVVFASPNPAEAARQCGRASWYALPRNRTANGERMNPNAMTAAHRSLRFGRYVYVKNMHNGRRVRVRINDRGPFIRGRIIDVSRAAARRLGMINRGTARVCLSY